VYLEIGLNFIYTLKCMTNKITLNDLKMAEHLLVENCGKIVEIFFRPNINKNSRASMVKLVLRMK
jgi:hypothetical protein